MKTTRSFVSAILSAMVVAIAVPTLALAAPVTFTFAGHITASQGPLVQVGDRIKLVLTWDTAADYETGPQGPGICPESYFGDCWSVDVRATIGPYVFTPRRGAYLGATPYPGVISHDLGATLSNVVDFLGFVIHLSHQELFAGPHPPGALPADTTARLEGLTSDPGGNDFAAQLRIPEPHVGLLLSAACVGLALVRSRAS